MLASLFCKLLNHKVNRHRVWEDGLNFRTTCTRCAASLIRDDDLSRETFKWRAYDAQRDEDPRRKPHPRER